MAITTQGVQLFWSTSTAASTSTSNLCGEVTDIKGPTGSKAEIDITSLASSAKEYMMALADFGDVTVNFNYSGADVTQGGIYTDFNQQTAPKRRCVIKLTDTASHVLMFKGYVKAFAFDITKDSVVKVTAGFRISGQASLSTVMG